MADLDAPGDRFLSTSPDVWDGPSYLLAISRESGSEVLLAGWHSRLAQWERKIESYTDVVGHPLFGSAALSRIDAVAVEPHQLVSFEFETIAGVQSQPRSRRITDWLVGPGASEAMWSTIETLGRLPISANRDVDIPIVLAEAGARYFDLLLCTLPARRGRGRRDVAFCSRWVRYFVFPRGHIAIYSSPPEGAWSDDVVRWPHHGIPSRAHDFFTDLSHVIAPAERLATSVSDFLTHQTYFANSWRNELELWEQHVFRALTGLSSEVEAAELVELEKQLGNLAEYNATLRTAQRSLERRVDVSAAISSHADLRSRMVQAGNELAVVVAEDREILRGAMSLLSNIAASVQVKLAEKQRAAGERLQAMIGILSALFIVPSIVIGIYGANVAELSEGAKGTLSRLVLWTASSIVLSFAVLRFIRWLLGQSLVSYSLMLSLNVAVGSVLILLAVAYGSDLDLAIVSSALAVALLLLATPPIAARITEMRPSRSPRQPAE